VLVADWCASLPCGSMGQQCPPRKVSCLQAGTAAVAVSLPGSTTATAWVGWGEVGGSRVWSAAAAAALSSLHQWAVCSAADCWRLSVASLFTFYLFCPFSSVFAAVCFWSSPIIYCLPSRLVTSCDGAVDTNRWYQIHRDWLCI